MTKKTILASIGVLTLIAGCSMIGGSSVYPYSFKTVKIQYKVEGNLEGTSTVSIKGDRMVRESHVVNHKSTGDEKQNTMFIEDKGFIYNIDLDQKTGTMTQNPIYNELKALPPEKRADYLKRIAVGAVDDGPDTQETAPKGSDKVAGQECEVYETRGIAEICLWEGIPLRTTIKIPEVGMNNKTEATKIELNVDVPDSTFDVPKDIRVQKINVDNPEDGTSQSK